MPAKPKPVASKSAHKPNGKPSAKPAAASLPPKVLAALCGRIRGMASEEAEREIERTYAAHRAGKPTDPPPPPPAPSTGPVGKIAPTPARAVVSPNGTLQTFRRAQTKGDIVRSAFGARIDVLSSVQSAENRITICEGSERTYAARVNELTEDLTAAMKLSKAHREIAEVAAKRAESNPTPANQRAAQTAQAQADEHATVVSSKTDEIEEAVIGHEAAQRAVRDARRELAEAQKRAAR